MKPKHERKLQRMWGFWSGLITLFRLVEIGSGATPLHILLKFVTVRLFDIINPKFWTFPKKYQETQRYNYVCLWDRVLVCKLCIKWQVFGLIWSIFLKLGMHKSDDILIDYYYFFCAIVLQLKTLKWWLEWRHDDVAISSLFMLFSFGLQVVLICFYSSTGRNVKTNAPGNPDRLDLSLF